MVVGRGDIWAVGSVFQHLETQMVNGFNGLAGRVWVCIVMQQQARKMTRSRSNFDHMTTVVPTLSMHARKAVCKPKDVLWRKCG